MKRLNVRSSRGLAHPSGHRTDGYALSRLALDPLRDPAGAAGRDKRAGWRGASPSIDWRRACCAPTTSTAPSATSCIPRESAPGARRR